MKRKESMTVDKIKQVLVASGAKPTAQRVAICKYVLCDGDHPTAEVVKVWADQNFPMVSRATVYNTLNLLVAKGLLKEVKLPHTNKVMYDCNIDHHYHFYNSATDALVDIDPKEVVMKSNVTEKYDISKIEITFHGKQRKK
ncbi:MAG: transcriptional repressor [Bdellovibrionota bacterium]